MEKKQSPKMAALMQLRQMVEDLINEDFKSDKMPKLMALKIKMTPEHAETMDEVETPEEDMGEEQPEAPHTLSEAIKAASEAPDSELGTEPCEECGKTPCECDEHDMGEMGMGHEMGKKPMVKAIAIKTTSVESPGVAKLKKLLGK